MSGWWQGSASYLAFDVNSTEGLFPRVVEELASFPRKEGDVVSPLIEQVLAVVVDDKLHSLGVGLKAQLLGDESEFHVRLVSI